MKFILEYECESLLPHEEKLVWKPGREVVMDSKGSRSKIREEIGYMSRCWDTRNVRVNGVPVAEFNKKIDNLIKKGTKISGKDYGRIIDETFLIQ